MIAMIFEFWMDLDEAGAFEQYSAMSSELRAVLAHLDGFGGVERFESCSEPGKFVAIGSFHDEAAVTEWRNTALHRRAQELGRNRFFTNYRLRMADVVRDYGPTDRAQAPTDSNDHHDHRDGC